MKSQSLLISALLLLSCTFKSYAQESPADIYSQAKSAFEKNECRTTVNLLTKYLTLEIPKKAKLDSIYAVIGWCAAYSKEGQIYHRISGIMGPDRSYYEETSFGKEMKKYKKALP